MALPTFPESQHPKIQALVHLSDLDLLTLFKRYPEQGQYFVAIFCRYYPIVYTLIAHSLRSPVQVDYLFALTWRHIFYEMRSLAIMEEGQGKKHSFQNWLIAMTTLCVKEVTPPPVETINYDLARISPPLFCYLEQALELIAPLARLILVMADNFHWSETRIAAYLQAEGESLSPQEVTHWRTKGYELLEATLPEDIRTIYLPADLRPENSPIATLAP